MFWRFVCSGSMLGGYVARSWLLLVFALLWMCLGMYCSLVGCASCVAGL